MRRLKTVELAMATLAIGLWVGGCEDASDGEGAAPSTPTEAGEAAEGDPSEADPSEGDPTPEGDPSESGGSESPGEEGADPTEPEVPAEPEPPAVEQFHRETGTQLRRVVDSKVLHQPMDLAFNINRPDELWVVSKGNHSFTIMEHPGTPEAESHVFPDMTLHFKQEVIAIAFGDEWTFGTCGDSDNSYSGRAEPNFFMGPVMWESTIDNFYEHNFTTPGGPHIDMLHNSPLCTGIAWESKNRFYANNGLLGSVEWYDFREPHPHGESDHSDGITRRLVQGVYTRVDSVPSHMELDHSTGWLYLADPGGNRVVRIDTLSGDVIGNLFPNPDFGAEAYVMDGVDWEVFADGEALGLEMPSGMAMDGRTLFIGDWMTGVIHAFDMDTGDLLDSFDTQRGPESISGLEIGPLDGLLYFADAYRDEVVRIEPMGF